MNKPWRLLPSVLALPLLAALAVPAFADERDHRFHERERERDHHDFHGHDFHHFGPEEMVLWRGGRWHHGWHEGQFGWWWQVDGFWYFYSRPIYPYPTYVAPAMIIETPPPPPPPPAIVVQPAPPPMLVQPPPPVVVQQAPRPPGQAAAQSWYYCEESRAYYPYVQTCASQWRQVPANAARPALPNGG